MSQSSTEGRILIEGKPEQNVSGHGTSTENTRELESRMIGVIAAEKCSAFSATSGYAQADESARCTGVQQLPWFPEARAPNPTRCNSPQPVRDACLRGW